MHETKETIRAFLATHLGDRHVGDDEDIFSAGYVTSLFALQLVLFVEKEFGLSVRGEDLNLDNFRSIAALVSFIHDKRAA